MKTFDWNLFEQLARDLMDIHKFRNALCIYYYMADGDPSLDAGYLGYRIGLCYQKLGEIEAARYWYGKAVEENPTVKEYIEAKEKIQEFSPEDVYNKLRNK